MPDKMANTFDDLQRPREIEITGVEITGVEIKSVEIKGTRIHLKKSPKPNSRIIVLPDELSDGPWPVVLILPDGTPSREFNFKYQKTYVGKNQIKIATPRESTKGRRTP
jgi:hypothetical protein